MISSQPTITRCHKGGGEGVAECFGSGDSRISLGPACVETSAGGLETGVVEEAAVEGTAVSAVLIGEVVTDEGVGESAQMALTGNSVGGPPIFCSFEIGALNACPSF